MVIGGLEISTRWRRNLNLRVRRPGRPGYLIKQHDPLRPGGRRTLAAEVSFYSFCAEEPRAAAVKGLLPVARVTLLEGPLVVVEWVEGADSLWRTYRSRPATVAQGASRALGRGLGELHSCLRRPGLGEDERLASLPERPAGFLSSHRPHPGELRRLSAANHRLYRLIQDQPAMVGGLERAHAEWRTDTVIHGDVRSANVLIVCEAEGKAEVEPRLRLIDWELAKHGDAAWDVGSVLADFVHFWVKGQPQDLGLDPEARARAAKVPLAALQPAIRTFWRGYLSASGLSGAAASSLLERAVLYSGARLIQAAWQHSSRSSRLSELALLLLQVSRNVLAEPRAAAEHLYGLLAAEPAAAPLSRGGE